jgi:AraC-like DNA-binding protein
VDALQARFVRRTYDRHSHATYSIGVTDEGVQAFRCRGADHASTAGIVLLLNPDDVHDGHAGSAAGFRYRMLYLGTDVVADALDPAGRAALPLFRQPLVSDRRLGELVRRAHTAVTSESASALERDGAVRAVVTHAVARWAGGRGPANRRSPSDGTLRGLARVREHLHAHVIDDVTVAELAAVAGVSRGHLARSFRAVHGQTLHAYQRSLRLGLAAERLAAREQPALVAAATGFVDQAHLTRWFKTAFGMTPGAWRSLASPFHARLTTSGVVEQA